MKIAILGIDGVGKSTVINEIKRKYSNKKIKHYHFMPMNHKNSNKTINFTKIRTYNLFISQLKLIYIFIKFNFLWFFNVKLLSSDIIIFDRIVFDAAIDNERYLFNNKTLGLKMLFFFRNYVDKVLVLTCDRDEILRRNKENSAERIDEIQNLYKAAAKKFDFIRIDTNAKPSSIINLVVKQLEKTD